MVIDKDSFGTIGFVCLLAGVVLALVLIFVHAWWLKWPLSAIILVFMFFVVWFHRVPVREKSGGERVVSSVADGKVVIVEKAFEGEYLHRECIQVSIYMNFFDVHANFWPVSGRISYYKYHPGRYMLAFLPKASELNEHSSTCISCEGGEVFFKQIAGTFARRIVCHAEEGKEVVAGEQLGIIKFGSRIDMFLPLDADVKVKVGDLTRASETVIALL